MDKIQKRLLEEVADLHEIPAGAYNIRANGQMTARNTTANINIVNNDTYIFFSIKSKHGPRKKT